MGRSLRKGSFSVYLQYPNVGDSIGAEMCAVERDGDTAIISLRLRPAGRNEKEDERNLHEQKLISATIDDHYIINNLKRFLEHNLCHSMALKIFSMRKTFAFHVHPDPSDSERLHMVVYD